MDPISRVVLTDTVTHLQREMNELRSDSLFNHTGETPTSPQRSRWTTFTSTKIPKFAGVTSWDQYRQEFDAIVLSNGWDDATAALQLLSHLEGDALSVALLVPASRWASRVGLVDALSAHYGSLGRLADFRLQFESTTRTSGEDPAIFATALETLAIEAFGDMGQTARLRIVRDRFIAGQISCELCRHLDSVAAETPIQDIVDHCRVWESHADPDVGKGRGPSPGWALPLNDVGEAGDDLPVAAMAVSPTEQALLESLLEQLLPTPVRSSPDATPIPSELELLLQRLLGDDRPVQPGPIGQSGINEMEILLQNLLLVCPSPVEWPPQDTARRDRVMGPPDVPH